MEEEFTVDVHEHRICMDEFHNLHHFVVIGSLLLGSRLRGGLLFLLFAAFICHFLEFI
jgi:hypothetical protein